MKRIEKALIAAGALLVLVALGVAFAKHQKENSKYAAQNACSCLYVTGDPEKMCREILGADFRTDAEARSVELNGFVSKYVSEQRGCSVAAPIAATESR